MTAKVLRFERPKKPLDPSQKALRAAACLAPIIGHLLFGVPLWIAVLGTVAGMIVVRKLKI